MRIYGQSVISAERVYLLSFGSHARADQVQVFDVLDVAMHWAETSLGYQVDEDMLTWTHTVPGRMPEESVWYLAPKDGDDNGAVIRTTRILREAAA
jgi:hypothetical protein